ncbi:MAG: tetratricopeptide repeat protein [Candidatus Electrothrix sp. Rat3]|nr:tetratricopeptide repeat protein [Candidatus Electrothrix rattekaaiensis]
MPVIVYAAQSSSHERVSPCPGKTNQQSYGNHTMVGNIIDWASSKLQWLLENPGVTWSGIGVYALTLLVSALIAVVSYLCWRKNKSSADNTFTCNNGEQNNAQGDHATGKLVNNHGPVISTSGNQSPAIHGPNATVNYNIVSPEALADVRKLAVTESALASFFRILEEQQVARGDLDAKLREIAMRHVELLQRFEAVSSDDPEVQALKKEVGQAIENGKYDRADELLDQIDERHDNAIHQLHKLQAETAARLEKEQLGKAENLVSKAKLQEMQYRYKKAAEYWQEAATALPEGHKEKRADCLSMAAYDFYCISKFLESILLWNQCLLIYQETDNRWQEANTLNSISGIYQSQGELRKALKKSEQSLCICREIGDRELESAALNNISQIFRATGDYSKALSYLKQCLLLVQKSGEKAGEGAILHNIGRIYYVQKNYETALRYYQQALAISRSVQDKRLESAVLNSIGQVYHDQENYDAAMTYFEQSLMTKQQIGDRKGEGLALNNIAGIYKEKEDYKTALQYLVESLTIFSEIGVKAEASVTVWNIGQIYEEQGDLHKTSQYMKRAIEMMEQIGHPKLEESLQALEAVRTKLRRQHK